MTLENKITIWDKAKRAVAGITAGVMMLGAVGGCGAMNYSNYYKTERTHLDTEWIDHNDPEYKVTSTNIIKKKRRVYSGITNPNFRENSIKVSLLERIIEDKYKRETQELVQHQREMDIVEVNEYQSVLGSMVLSGMMLLSYGGSVGAAFLISEDEFTGFVLGQLIGVGIISLYISANGFPEGESTENIPTGRERDVPATDSYRSRTNINETKISEHILSETPLSASGVTFSGPLVGEQYLEGSGPFTIKVSTPEYPIFFVEDAADIYEKVNLRWVKPTCREGVAQYIAQNAVASTSPLHVKVESGLGGRIEDSPLESEELDLLVPVYRAPKREEVIRFVVGKYINSNIQTATITFDDAQTHQPAAAQVRFVSRSAPQPEQLAEMCFSSSVDQRTAMSMMENYLHSSIELRVDGTQRLSVFIPSAISAETGNQNYSLLFNDSGDLKPEVHLTR